MANERAYAEGDERLRTVRAQAHEWRARAEAGRAAAKTAIAARQAAARTAMARAGRLQRAAVDSFAERVAAQREHAARIVDQFNHKRGRS